MKHSKHKKGSKEMEGMSKGMSKGMSGKKKRMAMMAMCKE